MVFEPPSYMKHPPKFQDEHQKLGNLHLLQLVMTTGLIWGSMDKNYCTEPHRKTISKQVLRVNWGTHSSFKSYSSNLFKRDFLVFTLPGRSNHHQMTWTSKAVNLVADFSSRGWRLNVCSLHPAKLMVRGYIKMMLRKKML